MLLRCSAVLLTSLAAVDAQTMFQCFLIFCWRKVTHLLIIIYFKYYSKKKLYHMVIKHLIILSYVTISENQLFFLGIELCLVSENAKQECKINSINGCPRNLICLCLCEVRDGPVSVHKAFVFPKALLIFIVFSCHLETLESSFVVLLRTIHWLHPFKTFKRFCLFAERYPTVGAG